MVVFNVNPQMFAVNAMMLIIITLIIKANALNVYYVVVMDRNYKYQHYLLLSILNNNAKQETLLKYWEQSLLQPVTSLCSSLLSVSKSSVYNYLVCSSWLTSTWPTTLLSICTWLLFSSGDISMGSTCNSQVMMTLCHRMWRPSSMGVPSFRI
jgi:hypothetical protein